MSERRFFLKNGLLVILGMVGLAGTKKAAAMSAKPDLGPKYGMVIDINRCTGCQSCVIACKAQNKTLSGHFNTKVLSFEDGNYPDSRVIYNPVQCNQCENPPCVDACPIDATFKLPNGIVVTDWDICQGIGECVKECPYDARFLDTRHMGADNGKADKCDFCVNRLEQGLEPACVEACSPKARIFGDLNAPKGEFADYIKRFDIVRRKPELKIKTNLLYVPSRKSKKGGVV